MTYFNIHAHTDYSNIRGLDSTNTVEGLITLSHKLGLKGVCITDHETLSGHVKALKFIQKKKKDEEWKDFKLGLGNEIYLCRDGLNAKNYTKGEDGFWHFILVAKDSVGHKQLRQLSSRAWQRSFYQFIERVPTYYSDIEEIVGADPGHLIASTACLGGFFPKLVLADKTTKAENFINWGKSIFGEDFYIELQPGLSEEQLKFNRLALDYAKKLGVKPIITTDAHYPRQEDRPIHKAFLTSNESEREVDEFYASTFSMSAEEIVERFEDDLKEAATECLQNTLEIYDKIEEYDLSHSQIIPRVPFNWNEIKSKENVTNKYEYIDKFITSPHEEDNFYVQLVLQGAKNKRILDEIHLARINTELEQIWNISETQNQRLSTYFLTVRKVIDTIWDSGSIVGDGRGSVATHVCSYCTDIIQYDPLKSPIELPYWRFLASERPEYPDIDIDFEASKREKVITNLKNYFQSIGGDLVAVATFGTTTSKSALQSAARGLGYEPEVGTYLSSLVPIDRGFVRTLKQCYYGDEEKGYTPVPQFVKEMDTYSDIWEVAQGIEGLISRRGRHACGVLPVNGDFTEHNAIMKAPDGGLISQYELHDSESIGGMKFDALTTDFLDRIHCCLDLLSEYGYIEWQSTLRNTYNKYLNPNVIRYDEPEMWELAINNKVSSLFQFDTPSGLQTIKLVKPHSLGELAQANSLMRLMPEGRDKTPTEEYIAYKNNMQLFYNEIERLNGTKEEKEALIEILEPLYGVADGQEAAMRLLMHPKLFGFSIKEGHGARKLIAKKQIKEISNYRDNLFKIAKEKGISEDVVHYIWDVQIGRQLGYSFSYPHTISYSIIAVQALNLAYYYPIIYWNTACLIVDSDGLQDEDVEIVTDDIDEEDGDTKKKVKPIRYDKISTAIGKMMDSGIKVIPPNINRSKYTFTPDEDNDSIIYGLRGITRINAEVANDIISGRPYTSFDDFNERAHLQTLPTLNLIKSGAFDEFEDRIELMKRYIGSISDQKKKLTLANLNMVISHNLVPDEYKFYEQLFNFHKYLKTTKVGIEYCLDNYSLAFYEQHFDTSQLSYLDGNGGRISAVVWDKMYKKSIEGIRKWLTAPETLDKLNKMLYDEVYNKYAAGSISKWEMDSIGFYYHTHELNELETKYLGLSDFSTLSEDPEIDNTFITNKGQRVFIYKLHRFAGTVIGKDKLKNIVTLLTPTGVVKVKVYRPQFSKYDRQIAEKDEITGKKTIVEKSWFTRGNMLIVTGIRRGDFVVPKYYKNTPYQPFELITDVDYTTRSFHIKEERDG